MAILIPARFSHAARAGPLRDGQVLRLAGETMGTCWSVQWVARAPGMLDALRCGIDTVLADLVAQLSHWQADSALCRYNRAPAGSRHPLPPDFARVLDAALDIAEASDGALDPTIGPLVDLWGFGPPGPRRGIPDAVAVAAARARVGWRALHRNDQGLLQPGGVQLDLSAIGKGHAVDRLAIWLERAGIVHHLVEIGGELRGQGVKPDGQPWWVEVERGSGPPLRIALDGLSVATSGSTVRRFEHEGRHYAHSLDPRSGAPLENAPAAVTVIHPLCREADGWATALTVFGVEPGLALADARALAVRYLIDGRPRCSRAWRAMLDDGGDHDRADAERRELSAGEAARQS